MNVCPISFDVDDDGDGDGNGDDLTKPEMQRLL